MIDNQLESALKEHVNTLCASERNTGNCPEGLRRAEEMISQTLAKSGYRVTKQEFPADGMTCANLDAVSPHFAGLNQPHIIIGAHYDSAPGTPGADDNASAVAILLELGRLLAKKPCARSIRFVAYANEEPPHFCTPTMGSVVHAKACRKRGDKITGMICLESLGVFSNEPGSQELPAEFNLLPDAFKKMLLPPGLDPTVGNFLAVIGNPASAEFMGTFVGRMANDDKLPVLALKSWTSGFPTIWPTGTKATLRSCSPTRHFTATSTTISHRTRRRSSTTRSWRCSPSESRKPSNCSLNSPFRET